MGDFLIHPTIVALTMKSEREIVDIFNRSKFGTVEKTTGLSEKECSLLNGLLLYHILSKNDLLVEKRRYASHKANLSGRIFEDTFRQLFQLWMKGRSDIFLAYVDKVITGIDYVVYKHDPLEFLAGIQCRFSLGGTSEDTSSSAGRWNHWRKLKDDLEAARDDKRISHIPLAAVVFQSGPSVPKPLARAVDADISATFLNHGGVTDLKVQTSEIKQLANWLQRL